MKNKHLGIIFLLLVLACGVSIFLYSSPVLPTAVIPVKTGIQTMLTPPPTLDPRLRGDDNAKEKKITNQPTTEKITPLQTTTEIKSATPPVIPDVPQIPVTLKILDKNYETTINENSTVYDLMKKMEETQGLQFTSKEYSGLGHFVEEINGVKNNNQAGIYWLYYVNGQSASIGISNYHLKSNDIISWKYDKAQF